MNDDFVPLLEDVLNRRFHFRAPVIAEIVVEMAVAATFAAETTTVVVLFRNEIRRLFEIMRLDVANVQKSVASDAEIDERRLNALLDVDDHALINVPDVIVVRRSFDVKLFENAVFDDRDAAFFRLPRVHQHFLRHKNFTFLRR